MVKIVFVAVSDLINYLMNAKMITAIPVTIERTATNRCSRGESV